ncbi:MAG: hypothetical protein R3C03_01825 [Pirellulaceae bacterium]
MTRIFYDDVKIQETMELIQGIDLTAILPKQKPAFVPSLREPSEDTGVESDDEKRIREADEQRRVDEDKAFADQEKVRVALRVEKLRALLAANREFESKMTSNQDVYFGSARFALDRFARILAYSTDRDLKEKVVDPQLKIIAENYPLVSSGSDRMAIAKVGDALGYLESSLQHGQLVTAIRRKHSLPNAMVLVHSNLLAARVSRSNSEVRPVNEIILGRQIFGDALTSTNVNLELLPNSQQIAASIHLHGTIESDTYTHQGRITAFAGSNGEFEARRNVFANVGGFYAKAPYVAANIQSYFKSVSLNLRIAQRIGQKTFTRDKERSEGIAAARAEIRINDEFREQTDEPIANGVDRLSEAALNMNPYRTAIPSLYAHSESDRILAFAHKVDPFHLAANSEPESARVPADVNVRLHESMLINYVDPIFVGRTLTNEQIAERVSELLGSTPEAFAADPEEDPWSITFARVQPFQFEIDDNRIRIGIIGERFTRGTSTIRSGLVIKATYCIVRKDGALYLAKMGDITVDYAEGTQPDGRTVSFKTFLEKKLNSINDGGDAEPGPDNEIPLNPGQGNAVERQNEVAATSETSQEFDGVKLPDNLIPVDQIKAAEVGDFARQLSLVEIRMAGGWLYLGWKHIDPLNGAGTVLSVDTPAIVDYSEYSRALIPAAPEPGLPELEGTKTEGDTAELGTN